ncbi:MAG: hypothetical protein WA131_01235 [Desulfitobacteriaceae bacterium]
MENLLKQESFIRTMFDTIPLLTLVLDPDLRVYAVNQAAKNSITSNETEFLGESCGQVLGCRHASDDASGCGFGPNCKNCIIRNTALRTIKGTGTQRAKGKLELSTGKDMSVLVSSSPFEYSKQQFALIMVEDVSLITELQGLIPICAACKRIRDDQGYWNRVEIYIEEHSEVEFTHDICPDCIKALYPDVKQAEKTKTR